MTESVVLMFLGSFAAGGVGWTLWDIRSDLRRRKYR